jgi:hypothetical protein
MSLQRRNAIKPHSHKTTTPQNHKIDGSLKDWCVPNYFASNHPTLLNRDAPLLNPLAVPYFQAYRFSLALQHARSGSGAPYANVSPQISTRNP